MEPTVASLPLLDLTGVALGLGLGTLALRIGGAEMRHRIRLSATAERALEWLPVAALAAMISPLFAPTDSPHLPIPLWLAALASTAVVYRTRNMLWGVGGGMLIYWLAAWFVAAA